METWHPGEHFSSYDTHWSARGLVREFSWRIVYLFFIFYFLFSSPSSFYKQSVVDSHRQRLQARRGGANPALSPVICPPLAYVTTYTHTFRNKTEKTLCDESALHLHVCMSVCVCAAVTRATSWRTSQSSSSEPRPRAADRQGATRTWRHPAPVWWWVSSGATGTLTAEAGTRLPREQRAIYRETPRVIKKKMNKCFLFSVGNESLACVCMVSFLQQEINSQNANVRPGCLYWICVACV